MCLCFLCGTLQVLMDRYVRNSGLLFFFFFLNLEETVSTCTLLMFMWVKLHGKMGKVASLPCLERKTNIYYHPLLKTGSKASFLHHKPEFGTFVTLPGLNSCFAIVPHHVKTSKVAMKLTVTKGIGPRWFSSTCSIIVRKCCVSTPSMASTVNSQLVSSNWCLTFLSTMIRHAEQREPHCCTLYGWNPQVPNEP